MRTVSLTYHSIFDTFYAADSLNVFDTKRRKEYPRLEISQLSDMLIRDFNLEDRKTVLYLYDDFPKDFEEILREAFSRRKTKVKDITRKLPSE